MMLRLTLNNGQKVICDNSDDLWLYAGLVRSTEYYLPKSRLWCRVNYKLEGKVMHEANICN